MAWQPIFLSAKVFGHLSQGLYRTPAGAIKELISNSFDADARIVRIHTGFPRFETFSCKDDGTGMEKAEFLRLVTQGIGSSYKRVNDRSRTDGLDRPLIGRLGLGILALAQICTQFDIISHHRDSRTAFKATIKFPPYTRQEMDKIAQKSDGEDRIQGGEFQIVDENYDVESQGVGIFTKYLREPFRKRMRSFKRPAGSKRSRSTVPYGTFSDFLNSIYRSDELTPSLNLRSDYEQLLFGLALSPPLPFVSDENVVLEIPSIKARQALLKGFKFKVEVDNLVLECPLYLPSDRLRHSAEQCKVAGSTKRQFVLEDGPIRETCTVTQHTILIKESDERFHVYEFRYSNKEVAGVPLSFSGYIFQQTGRLYPRDIQGVLIRLNNIAIGKYDNSMLTYPLAEGPRYSMISSEVIIEHGFDDALNIDRDSFNELHPHYIRVQSYVHGLLHDLIFPESWGEEKERNKTRREKATVVKAARFVENLRKATGDPVRTISRASRTPLERASRASSESPVEFNTRGTSIEIDESHPLLKPVLKRKKHAALVERLVVAFERANREPSAKRRRELFYTLLTQIFSDL